jgi:predicted membrane chloride channel (bestrophin family)
MSADGPAAGAARWTPRALLYLVLAAVGLVGTWTYNVTAILEKRDYLGDWFQSGPSVSSLTTDLLVVAVAAVIFMIVEGRRLRMKRVWLFVLAAPFIALAFALPLFLAFRERALTARDDVTPDP